MPISDLRDRPVEINEPVQVTKRGIEPKLNSAEGIYNGTPNATDLEKIRRAIGGSAEADDWAVWSFLAFDNTYNLDHMVFSPSVVSQYAQRAVGKNMMVDHAWWDSNAARGTIIDAAVYQLDRIPEFLAQDLPQREASESFVEAAGGYYWVHVKAAVRVESPLHRALSDRAIDCCSIGAKAYDGRTYCPNCTQSNGHYVGFWDEEEVDDGKGNTEKRYTCPHTALTSWNLFLASYYGEEVNFSDGVLFDAAVMPVELSGVMQGAIATARVIRN